jgi:hypothetical protein
MSSRPAIDHSLLSPSGRCSKRARNAAMTREAARLFPPGYWDEPIPTEEEKRVKKIASLRAQAAACRTWASQGIQPRKLLKQATQYEAEAIELETGGDIPK